MTVEASLHKGLRLADKRGHEVLYRYVRESDDIERMTDMLHDAFAALAARGMRFSASHQGSDITRARMAQGETIVATDEDIVGVVTLKHAGQTHGSPFYERPDVAGVGQFAVRPSHQGRGIGAALLRIVEQRASEMGVRQLALDTSEHATELIALYRRRGFAFVEYARWPDVNYRSVVLSKVLP